MKTGLLRLGALTASAVLLGIPMRAEDPPPCPAIDPPALVRQGSAGQAGLRAFRDPVTGELRQPTAEEAAAAARAEVQAVPELRPVFEVVVHPDGMKTVDLQGAFLMAAVATRNPDGSITVRCLPAGAAPGAPAASPPARPAVEEK